MTLQRAIIAARRRVLRPEGYQQAAGAFFAFLMIAAALRLLSNIYVGHLLMVLNAPAAAASGDPSAPLMARFFARANLSWCGLFLASAAPIIAYRGVARTVRSPRMRLTPLSGRRLRTAATGASLRSLPVLLAVGLSVAIAVGFLLTPMTAGMVDLLLFLLIEGAGFLLLFNVAWYVQAEGRRLELIEIGLFVGMIFANPELMIVSGEPRVLYFFGTVVISASRSALLFGLPLLGAVAVSAFVLVSEAVARERRRHIGGKRRPGLVLYRSHIPLRLFAVTYAVEVPVILTNPAVATTVRNMVLILLGIRVVWFLLFVFRTEQEIGRVLGAPWKLADRLPVYRPAAGVHALLCVLPVFLYVARVMVE